MSSNVPLKRDVKTLGLVLRRTNYGEADRILSVITPEGKVSVIAKGVRKARSKLAGAVEMFTVSELMIHFGRGEMGTLTGAKMVRHFSALIRDLGRLELASEFLKKVDRVAENSDSSEYYELLEQGLSGLNDGLDTELVEAWFLLNLGRASGEEVNLYRDVAGEKLVADALYEWDEMEEAFSVRAGGAYGADEIKLMRLMLTAKLEVIARVKCDEKTIRAVARLARIV